MALRRRPLRATLLVTALLAGALVSATSTRADTTDFSFTSPQPGTTLSGTAVPLSVHSAAGISGGWWWVDGTALDPDFLFDTTSRGADHIFLVDTTFLTPGPHTFEYRYGDGRSVSRQFSVRNVPPTVSFGPRAAGASVSGRITVGVDASADPQGAQDVASVEFSVDGRSLHTDDVPPFEVDLDTRTLPNGPHELSARATDSVGLIGAASTTGIDVTNLRSAITASAQRALTVAGVRLALKATLTSPDTAAPIAGATLALYARPANRTGWRLVATAVSDAAGRVLVRTSPVVPTRYQWRFDGGAQHQAAAGPPVLVTVRPRLDLALGTRTAHAGAKVAGTVKITPATSGQPLTLQVRPAGGRWHTLRTLRSATGTTRVVVIVTRKGLYDVRVHRSADALGAAADSTIVRLRAT